MPFATIRRTKLYYEVQGEGTPVVFAHGRGGSHLSWWQQVPAFAKRHRVVTFDHRGFGQSRDRPRGPGRAAHAEDLRALLDHLDIEAAYLVGQSMGGWTSLGFAVAHPARVLGLVLADSSAGIRDERIFGLYRAKGEPPGDVVTRVLSAGFRRRHPAMAFLYGQLSALNSPPREALMDLLLSRDGPTARTLRRLAIPTLVIVGKEDIVVTPAIARRAAALIPDARLRVVAGAGHSVYFEKPALFNALVLRFIGETARRRTGARS